MKKKIIILISVILTVIIAANIITDAYSSFVKFGKKGDTSSFKTVEKESFTQEVDTEYLSNISKEEIYKLKNNKKDAWIYIGRPSCPDCQAYYPQLLKQLKDNQIKIYYFNTECKASEKSNMKQFVEEMGIVEIPSIICIKNGKVSAVYKCLIEDDLESLNKKLLKNN